jgi:hypothetical protein
VRARPSSENLTQDEFARPWPRLYHMAQAGSWPSIKRHGLLSTTAPLDHFEAWIRDNKPITPATLRRHPLGMTEEECYRELTSRVFLWLIHAARRSCARCVPSQYQ